MSLNECMTENKNIYDLVYTRVYVIHVKSFQVLSRFHLHLAVESNHPDKKIKMVIIKTKSSKNLSILQ